MILFNFLATATICSSLISGMPLAPPETNATSIITNATTSSIPAEEPKGKCSLTVSGWSNCPYSDRVSIIVSGALTTTALATSLYVFWPKSKPEPILPVVEYTEKSFQQAIEKIEATYKVKLTIALTATEALTAAGLRQESIDNLYQDFADNGYKFSEVEMALARPYEYTRPTEYAQKYFDKVIADVEATGTAFSVVVAQLRQYQATRLAKLARNGHALPVLTEDQAIAVSYETEMRELYENYAQRFENAGEVMISEEEFVQHWFEVNQVFADEGYAPAVAVVGEGINRATDVFYGNVLNIVQQAANQRDIVPLLEIIEARKAAVPQLFEEAGAGSMEEAYLAAEQVAQKAQTWIVEWDAPLKELGEMATAGEKALVKNVLEHARVPPV